MMIEQNRHIDTTTTGGIPPGHLRMCMLVVPVNVRINKDQD
jgi:hypothetical protein